ncbi:MAG TPA: hypothetical protein VHQ47_06110 [Phycisphaerae bacterium]|nr:hypothetical protein [Phycisphaerae bacterium]
MNERLMERFSTLVRDGAATQERQPATESEGIEDLLAFGVLRGIRERAVMLELRKRTGNILAIDYGGLEVEFDPSEGIVLHTMSGRKVVIKGRNLNAVTQTVSLFHGLTRHRVSWVQEMGQNKLFQTEQGATVVESIAW